MPYNVADAARDMDDLIVRQAQVFKEKQGIDLRLGHRVEAVDPSAKTVRGRTTAGDPFQVSYDKLLIATGARAIIPEIPGVDSPGVMALKDLEDGRRIKAFIKDHGVRKVAILGMGYIAFEMCEAFRARNIEVEMVKPRPIFIPWMNEQLASMVKKEVEANQVKLRLGQVIEKIGRNEKGLHLIGPGLQLGADMVLVAVGVRPNSELAQNAGLALGPAGSIAVDRALRTADPDIFAAGDCADAFHVVTGERTWIPLALRASRAGWAVADNVLGGKVELQGVAGTAVFKVFDLEVASTGLSVEEAREAGFEPAEVVIRSQTRAHKHPGSSIISVQLVGDRKTGRLLGAQMVGKEGAAHRINAPAVALHAGMSVEEFGQTDLAYAPPFGPTWDPVLTAANQLVKAL
jgi:NADPH-dependent 2,4-dienoyl-CoA reductase/sulfur reductase-like enzyme